MRSSAGGRALRAPRRAGHRSRAACRCAAGGAAAGAQRALRRGRPHPPAELDDILGKLALRISDRMTRSQRAGRTLTLALHFGDMSRASRSRTLPHPTVDPAAFLLAARALLDDAGPDAARRGVTMLGLTGRRPRRARPRTSSSCRSGEREGSAAA